MTKQERRAIEQVQRVNESFIVTEALMKLIPPVIQKKELILNEFKTPDWTCRFQRGARVTATINIFTGQFIRFDFHE